MKFNCGGYSFEEAVDECKRLNEEIDNTPDYRRPWKARFVLYKKLRRHDCRVLETLYYRIDHWERSMIGWSSYTVEPVYEWCSKEDLEKNGRIVDK
jgi:hypothetical protein